MSDRRQSSKRTREPSPELAGPRPIAPQHALRVVLIFAVLMVLGTVGYVVFEDYPPLDAFYMTLITVTSIGYGEIHPLDESGRIFTSFLILGGVGNAAYGLGVTAQFFAEGGWYAFRRRVLMQKRLENVRDHTIVCGFGRLGSAIVDGLIEAHHPVVVVEREARVLELQAQHPELLYVVGDAMEDATLIQAGIKRARTLVAALDDDASNVFLTLTARVLHPKLIIHGRADDPNTLIKLRRAGADHQFSPTMVAGHRVARQIIRPAVMDLVELATRSGQMELAIEEFPIGSLKGCEGKVLGETPFWGQQEFMVLAIRMLDGTLRFPPRSDHRLQPGEHLIVMGKSSDLTRLPSRTL